MKRRGLVLTLPVSRGEFPRRQSYTIRGADSQGIALSETQPDDLHKEKPLTRWSSG